MTFYLSSFFNYSQKKTEISPQHSDCIQELDSASSKTNSYIDLETSERDFRASIINEHFRYAAYMYMGFSKSRYDGDEKGILLSVSNSSPLTQRGIIRKHIPLLKEITNIFIHTMGFKVDSNGNYYHTETGTSFNLIYDIERKEIIVCFMGLNTYHYLMIDDNEKKSIR